MAAATHTVNRTTKPSSVSLDSVDRQIWKSQQIRKSIIKLDSRANKKENVIAAETLLKELKNSMLDSKSHAKTI